MDIRKSLNRKMQIEGMPPYIVKGIENWVEIAWKSKWLDDYSFRWDKDSATESIFFCLQQHKNRKLKKDLILEELQTND